MRFPIVTVGSVPFHDFGGEQFERLVFSYHLRTGGSWKSLEWYGQVGSDLGRDIWGVKEARLETICTQCVNRQRLSLKKAEDDIDKIVGAPSGKPDKLIFVCSQPMVSSDMRDKIKAYAKARGIGDCEIWSGKEFDVRLHEQGCEPILLRFCAGELFPDEPGQLQSFVANAVRQPTPQPPVGPVKLEPRIIQKIKRPSIPDLKEILRDPDYFVRKDAYDASGFYQDGEGRIEFLRLLEAQWTGNLGPIEPRDRARIINLIGPLTYWRSLAWVLRHLARSGTTLVRDEKNAADNFIHNAIGSCGARSLRILRAFIRTTLKNPAMDHLVNDVLGLIVSRATKHQSDLPTDAKRKLRPIERLFAANDEQRFSNLAELRKVFA